MTIAAVAFVVIVLGGCLAFGYLLIFKQQRIYRDSDEPADMYRADDLESGPPFDPNAGPQTAEDFFAEGTRPQWRRGVRDERFSPHHPRKGPVPTTSPGSKDGLWEINGHEGWCADPFGRHEARWISDGVPTSLVRDGTSESHDDPPRP